MDNQKLFQLSTLSALALGYTRGVTDIETFLLHGDTGLGTFEDVDGEMIVADGHCYRAMHDGSIEEPALNTGIPFAAIGFIKGKKIYEFDNINSAEELKTVLNLKIEENFGLNSMHLVRIDGSFNRIAARSEVPYRSHHIELKDILSHTQEEFYFDNIKGSLICLYYPDYMDGINAPGWHFHFISEDRKKGGHVFELSMLHGTVRLDKINGIELRLPGDAAFDTYSLKEASQKDIKKVEQGG